MPHAEMHASPELDKPCRHHCQGCAQSQPQHQQPDALSGQRMPQVAAAEEVGWRQSIAHGPVSSKDLTPQVESVVPATAKTVSAMVGHSRHVHSPVEGNDSGQR